APGADGSVNPAANRAAFDAQVADAAQKLSAHIASALKNVPMSSTLATKINQSLVGPQPMNLQSGLAALTTPTDTNGPSMQAFRSQSFQVVSASLTLVLGDLSDFARTVIPGSGWLHLGKLLE